MRGLCVTQPGDGHLNPLVPVARALISAGHEGATVLRAPAEDLPYDDNTFDTVVSTLVLCGVDDQPRAVREIRRVLKPGGQLLFVEHVRSDDDHLARRQDRVNWFSRLTTNCDCNRPTLRTVEHGGFVVDHIRLGELSRSPSFVRPMMVGPGHPPRRRPHRLKAQPKGRPR